MAEAEQPMTETEQLIAGMAQDVAQTRLARLKEECGDNGGLKFLMSVIGQTDEESLKEYMKDPMTWIIAIIRYLEGMKPAGTADSLPPPATAEETNKHSARKVKFGKGAIWE